MWRLILQSISHKARKLSLLNNWIISFLYLKGPDGYPGNVGEPGQPGDIGEKVCMKSKAGFFFSNFKQESGTFVAVRFLCHKSHVDAVATPFLISTILMKKAAAGTRKWSSHNTGLYDKMKVKHYAPKITKLLSSH